MSKFVYGGFVKPEDLERAILAQNPEMDEQSRLTLRRDIKDLELLGSADSLIASMVEVNGQDLQDYAFMGMAGHSWRFNRNVPGSISSEREEAEPDLIITQD